MEELVGWGVFYAQVLGKRGGNRRWEDWEFWEIELGDMETEMGMGMGMDGMGL